MRAYIAAPYAAREQIKRYATELDQIGYQVTSRWLDEPHDINPTTTGAALALSDTEANTAARNDLDDIDGSDIFVVITARECTGLEAQRSTSGGRHVETGYALARGISVIVVGDPENIFHRMQLVTGVDDWHDAVIELSARLVAHERNRPRPAHDIPMAG